MSAESALAPRSPDAPGSIAAAIILGTVGVLSFIVQPGLVQGYVTQLGLSEAGANDLAFVEMAGVACATLVLAFISPFLNWRWIAGVALLVAALGNAASALTTEPTLLSAARMVTGFGEGLIIGLSFTMVGLTKKTERNLALYLVLLLTYGALGLWAMPTLFEVVGLQGIFYAWAGISAASLLLLGWIPASGSDHLEGYEISIFRMPIFFLVTALAGVLVYNVAIGVAWANLFLIGMEIRADEQAVADALLIAQFVAIGGALASVFLSSLLGRWVPLSVGILGGAAAIYPLLQSPSYMTFLISVSAFNFLWNFVLPFILASVADLDSRGRMMTPAIAMQMIGLGFGPFIAARILGEDGSFAQIELLTMVALVVAFAMIALTVFAHQRSTTNGAAFSHA